MVRLRYTQAAFGAGLLLLAVYLWSLSLGLRATATDYPRIVIALLVVVALVMIATGLRHRGMPIEANVSGAALPIVLTLVYVALFSRIDFRIITPLYILAMIWKHPQKLPPIRKALVAVGTTLTLYAVFVYGFSLPIP